MTEALLFAIPRSTEYPAYSERVLLAKLSRESSIDQVEFKGQAARVDDRHLSAAELEQILEHANLTDRQAEVLRRLLAGENHSEIGRDLQITKQGAWNIHQQALKKILRAAYLLPTSGLAAVYKSETRAR